MSFQMVSTGPGHQLTQRAALQQVLDAATTEVVIVCPFIQLSVAHWIADRIKRGKRSLTVRTVTSNPLSQPINDPRALRHLSDLGDVRWLPSLHAKAYMADGSIAFVTSANLSDVALDTQAECGVLIQSDPKGTDVSLTELRSYIDGLWDHALPFAVGELEEMVRYNFHWTAPHVQAFDHAGEMALDFDDQLDDRIARECFPERLAFRRHAEEEVFDIVLRWHSVGPDSATADDVYHFVNRFSEDIKPESSRTYRDRFTGRLQGNARSWYEHPSLFAKWCIEFVFGDPAEIFPRFWYNGQGALQPRGSWFWSANLYLRKKEGFYIYNTAFAPAIERAIRRPYSMPPRPTWKQYLGYCKLCSEYCSSRSIPQEFADLVMSGGGNTEG